MTGKEEEVNLLTPEFIESISQVTLIAYQTSVENKYHLDVMRGYCKISTFFNLFLAAYIIGSMIL